MSKARLAAAALALLSLSSVFTRADAATIVGGNTMDLALAYHGLAESLDGSPAAVWTGTSIGRRMIADAHDLGFKFMRVAVGGYGPSDATDINMGSRDALTPWLTNPATYWAQTDRMFADLDVAGIQIVPVLMWNPVQFPTLAHETVGAMVKGPSTSRLMAKSFIQSFLQRYGSRKTIKFVELTNEWNLLADLDQGAWCLQNGGTSVQCAPLDNFTTSDLAGFVTEMARFIHYTSPGMLVSSGFALPRASAWHLSQTPYSSPGGPDWTVDTYSQFAANIAQLHHGLDIVSVHIYAGDVRFGRASGTEGQTAIDVANIAHSIGEKVYVGEFGDTSQSPYLTSMFGAFANGQVDYTSLWALDFYQASTTQFAGTNSIYPDIDPQYTPQLDEYIGSQIAAPTPNPSEPPRVVLAAPAPCSFVSVGQPFSVYAQASGSTGISDVKYYVDGVQVADVSAPPYQAQISVPTPKIATISAAVSNGSTITWTTMPIAAGVDPASCTVPSPATTSSFMSVAPATTQSAPAVAQDSSASKAAYAAASSEVQHSLVPALTKTSQSVRAAQVAAPAVAPDVASVAVPVVASVVASPQIMVLPASVEVLTAPAITVSASVKGAAQPQPALKSEEASKPSPLPVIRANGLSTSTNAPAQRPLVFTVVISTDCLASGRLHAPLFADRLLRQRHCGLHR